MKKEKSITNYVIGYQNSLKKLESPDQSGILLCRNSNCDVIKMYLQQIQLRGKKVLFFQSVAERTIDTALYTYMKTTLTRQISLFVTDVYKLRLEVQEHGLRKKYWRYYAMFLQCTTLDFLAPGFLEFF